MSMKLPEQTYTFPLLTFFFSLLLDTQEEPAKMSVLLGFSWSCRRLSLGSQRGKAKDLLANRPQTRAGFLKREELPCGLWLF